MSVARVFGCFCYVAVPPELRPNGGMKRFSAIFVGYSEDRVGWLTVDLKGKEFFSCDVIFDELCPGRLGIPRSVALTGASPLPVRASVIAGRPLDEVATLAATRRASLRSARVLDAQNGGAGRDVVAETIDAQYGGAAIGAVAVMPAGAVDVLNSRLVNEAAVVLHGGLLTKGAGRVVDAEDDMVLADLVAFTATADHSPLRSGDILADIVSLVACETGPLAEEFVTMSTLEQDIVEAHCFASYAEYPRWSCPQSYDLSKAPETSREALDRPDAEVWKAAMDREVGSLEEMNAFEEADLPPGRKAIGLKWCFDIKMDSDGKRIHGKEKARLVAQGFSQRPEDYNKTYAPVAKMISIRIILAWAAVHDLEIYQFDCKTAFLHAQIPATKEIFGNQIPHYGLGIKKCHRVLRILCALYGLRQSAYEFYMLLLSLLLGLGLIQCNVDHAVFFGEWSTPPHVSIPMPANAKNLKMFVPIHVDDGLCATNSTPLYLWFIEQLSKHLHIVDMGECKKFLSICIVCDRPNRRLWLSSKSYIKELLDQWNMSDCATSLVPFTTQLADLKPAPPNALPEISDANLQGNYQRLVGELLYLAYSTRGDITYHAMALSQYSTKPTRALMLAESGQMPEVFQQRRNKSYLR